MWLLLLSSSLSLVEEGWAGQDGWMSCRSWQPELISSFSQSTTKNRAEAHPLPFSSSSPAMPCPALPCHCFLLSQHSHSSHPPDLQPSNNSISIHLLEQCNLSDKVVKPIETFRPGHHHKLFLGCRTGFKALIDFPGLNPANLPDAGGSPFH